MINKPTRINYRIFRKFTWPAGLPDFARYNLIYGWNGCGKTTLSNLFRRMERRQLLPTAEGTAEIDTSAGSVSAIDFSTAVLPSVRVFNRDFVDASVFATGSPIAPIFYFGAGSVEKQKKIEEARAQLNAKIEESAKLKTKLGDAERAVESFESSNAKLIKEVLSSAGKNPYNNYDKRDLQIRARALQKVDHASKRLSNAQKDALKQKISNQVQDPISELAITVENLASWHQRVAELLGKTVVSRVIPELSADETIADWVQTGIVLHTGSHSSETCRFCGNVLPTERLEALTAHFNAEYENFLGDISRIQAALLRMNDEIKQWKPPVKESFYIHLRKDSAEPLARIAEYQAEAAMYLPKLVTALDGKKAKPFAVLSMQELVPEPTPDSNAATHALTALHSLVTQHNGECANFSAGQAQARRELEEGLVAESIPKLTAMQSALEAARQAYTTSEGAIGKIQASINELELEISESVRPAEELTKELASYLGQSELMFEKEGEGYRITRGGVPALHLSEGEKTAISFLYFLKSLKDKSCDLKRTVVVIDDPISSLDSNAMFCAFGFMKSRTKEAGQIIILTHSFAFFRQVKNWFRHVPKGQKQLYLQRCEYPGGVRSATIGPLDPLLHVYESEYHYLFYRVNSEAGKPVAADLAQYYVLPNIARRLLETFLAFRYPVEGSLFQKLERVTYDDTKKSRIIRFLHTYSHEDKVSEPEHDLTVLSETPEVLNDLMALIRSEDAHHHDEMLKVLAASAAPTP